MMEIFSTVYAHGLLNIVLTVHVFWSFKIPVYVFIALEIQLSSALEKIKSL